MHSQAIELGFLEFVEARRREGAHRLFPDVKQNANGRWGDPVGKWFGGWRRKHGVAGKEHPMHALRNTVTTALGRAGVPVEVQKAVVGHEDEDVTSGLAGPEP